MLGAGRQADETVSCEDLRVTLSERAADLHIGSMLAAFFVEIARCVSREATSGIERGRLTASCATSMMRAFSSL